MPKLNSPPLSIYLGRIYTPLQGGGWLDIPNGAIAVNGEGKIQDVGLRENVLMRFPHKTITNFDPYLIVPGFVDCHQHLCHYDWVRLVPNLMEWLVLIYEFESRFIDLEYTRSVSRRFFSALIQNGTTTTCVHGPYFADATDTAFHVASELGLRVLMGMNSADKNIPAILCQSVSTSLKDATALYKKWNGAKQGLLSYCFTVRPAYCASKQLMQTISQSAEQFDARLQCHLSEDREGINAILTDFPLCKSDTDVYREVGLLSPRTIMAHGIYLTDTDRVQLSESGTSIIHCPRANLMAGGEQFDLMKAKCFEIPVGLGTDLGGSKGISMFRAMEDAMKVSPDLSIHDLFRMATLGGAAALKLSDIIGSLEIKKDADFLILCPKVLEIEGKDLAIEIEDLLSSLVFQGDDRDVKAVFVRGESIYSV